MVTASRSPQIGNGLTYAWEGESIAPGTAVRVPLRNKMVSGLVVERDDTFDSKSHPCKEIVEVFGQVLTPAHVAVALYVSKHYCCTLRDALKPFLPGEQWKKLLPEAPCDLPFPYVELNELSPPQQKALAEIRASKQPCLLFGSTGSGKTELYLHLIAECFAQKKQAIVLVPEIFLSEFLSKRLAQSVPSERTVIIHSHLTEAQKRKLWLKIGSGEACLIIGPRSALFGPCPNLGLIIMDEEHEWTYKSEQTPRYHARTVALELAKQTGAKLVLGTATPSLESWHAAGKEDLTLVRLSERYGHDALPKVHVVDLVPIAKSKHYPFSELLVQKISERLAKKEQCVLFINRRGYATSLLCLQCRRRVVSPESNLPLSVHHETGGRPFLLDHATGVRGAVPDLCPACGSASLLPVGAGTQKVESQLQAHFPQARVLRADRDTMTSPEEMHEILAKMQAGEADILLGTQLVTKGLHLPQVTLAAVLVADVGLSLPNFRMGERTFQLLTQLSGRSGRTAPGEVVIQAFRPEASEIQLAAACDVEGFLNQEQKMRAHFRYPPAAEMARLIYRMPDAAARAERVRKSLAAKHAHLLVNAAPLYANPKHWHVLLRGTNIAEAVATHELEGAVLDIDPLDVL